MKSIRGLVAIVAILGMVSPNAGSRFGWGQTATTSATPSSAVPATPVEHASPVPGEALDSAQTQVPDTRTEKQKALARQTEMLFDMAAELKVQVDKTNKNILSMKVVEKAEEIELLAKGMKGQVKH